MTLKEKAKTYSFWISLVSAALILARTIAEYCGVEINHNLVLSVATGICGILVIIGILSGPKSSKKIEDLQKETQLIEESNNQTIQKIKEDIQKNMENMTIEEQLEFLRNNQNMQETNVEPIIEQKEEQKIVEELDKQEIKEETFEENAQETFSVEDTHAEETHENQENSKDDKYLFIGEMSREELKEILSLILEKLELI